MQMNIRKIPTSPIKFTKLSLLKFSFLTLLISLSCVAVNKKTKTVKSKSRPVAQEILSKYQSASGIKSKIKRTIYSALLEEKKSNEGYLLLSHGKMKLTLGEPDPSLIVMSKDIIWISSPKPKEFGGNFQVMKILASKISKQDKSPIAFLLGQTSALDRFILKKEIAHDDTVEIDLVPKKDFINSEVVAMKLVLNLKLKLINKIIFSDDLENETTYEFEDTEIDKKIADAEFNYTPPKGAEVTIY
jgi:outer membrane lipoprotein-sorting protein